MQGQSIFAAEMADDPQSGTSMSNSEEEMGGRRITFRSGGVNPYTGAVYTHASRHANSEVIYGIDVSSHNGDINWGQVKASGIKYVIIRAAYRGYGSAGTLNKDTKFEANIRGALNAGLNVGVYIFSQAITPQEAESEADYILGMIRGYNITLPVVMDFEYASTNSGLGGRLYNAHLSVNSATRVCKTFCERISDAGYVPMVYANKSMLTNQLNASSLSKYGKIWLANYTTKSSYNGEYAAWQYSSQGRVSGIDGYVDCDFWYGESDTIYQGVDYSKIYNYEYYISQNVDLKQAFGNDRRKAIEHFVNAGMTEGRQAKQDFNVYTYKNRYADLRKTFGSDLKSYYMHYMYSGEKEGRDGSGTSKLINPITEYKGVDYSAIYDYSYYIEKYPDIRNALGNDDVAVLKHFVEAGMIEGRQGNNIFNVYTYKNRYSDLRVAFQNNLKSYYLHYVNNGRKEGRSGNGNSAIINPITVYEGIDYSLVYNYTYYINKYADIKRVYGDNDVVVLEHFVKSGMNEGRQGNAEFNVQVYKNKYVDLQIAYGNDLKKYYMHYIKTGKNEGRLGIQKKRNM